MRIGIDARLYNESGVGRYIRNLLNELQILDKENIYYIFLLNESFNKITFSNNFQKVLADIRWYGFSEQLKLPLLLNKYHLDLLHIPHFNVPLLYSGKVVVTIHDLIHQKFQMQRASTKNALDYKIKKIGYKKIFTKAINKSQKIFVVSEYIKEELMKSCQVPSEKIVITQEAVDQTIINLSKKITEKEIKKVIKKFNIKYPYLFYVGNAHPHKNIEGLINAFLQIKKNYQHLKLVLSGNDHYFWQKIKEQYRNKNIIYTGFVSDQELVALYKSSLAYVIPSLDEGFGIPLLEAFACGCPVLSSNIKSLQEVGGDAALYFDSSSREDFMDKLILIINNQALRTKLIARGQRRYKHFSWNKLAKQTLSIYQEVLKT
ncbi:glycosyltransferase family 4 protein [Candidatus Daviesbacteria bacterium]|nr:glycosyltransferase family 4 protein [Candidatus Daviesbacteria bacterium]